MPADARALIEGVYSADAQDQIPKALQDASLNAEGKSMVQKSMADLNLLKLNKGYTWNSGDWDEETKIPTRLTEEETVSVALAIFEDGRLKPYADVERYAWAVSTVKLPEREWKKAARQIPADLKQKIEDIKAEQKALRCIEVFPLTAETQHYFSAKDGWQTGTRGKA